MFSKSLLINILIPTLNVAVPVGSSATWLWCKQKQHIVSDEIMLSEHDEIKFNITFKDAEDASPANSETESVPKINKTHLLASIPADKNTTFKNVLNQLSYKKQELINKEKEFTKTFASVLDKMDAGLDDHVLLRFETLVNGAWEMGGDFYRSSFEPILGGITSQGWWFARNIGGNLTIRPRLSALLDKNEDPEILSNRAAYFSYRNISRNNKWTHVNFPCRERPNYRIESWNELTPIFSTEFYEQCDITGLQKADLSHWKTWLGINFDWPETEAQKHRMSITARHPYYEELETKRQKLARLLRLKKHLKEELETQSAQVIEVVKELQLSDDIAQPEQIQELVDKISKTF